MISHEHRAIFVHLRRTAGNSVELALGGVELFDAQGQPTTKWDNKLHRGSLKYKKENRGHYIHSTAQEIRKKFPKEFESYYKFSVVRNPWAQMVSLHLRLHSKYSWKWRFRRWVARFEQLEGTVPAKSLYDREGNLLVDYVARFETLDADFKIICANMGLQKPLQLPNANPSKEKAYVDFYDKASRQRVYDLFAEDIERYGYEFGQ